MYCWGTYQRNFVWKTDLFLFSDVIAKSPNKVRAYDHLANAYEQRDQIDEAIQLCRKGIALNPDFPDSHNNLGVCYLDKGWVDKAIMEFKHAIRINPNHAKSHYNLGIAYGARGQYDLAFEHIKTAKETSSKGEWEHLVKGIKVQPPIIHEELK